MSTPPFDELYDDGQLPDDLTVAQHPPDEVNPGDEDGNDDDLA